MPSAPSGRKPSPRRHWESITSAECSTRPPPGAPWSALDLAEPDGALLAFLLHPAPGLLERQARQCTAHAALIA
jgi:hypothetical protein